MTRNDLPFDEVWGVDAEFISRPGERPDVLCVCGYEAWSGRTFILWDRDLKKEPPHPIGTNALIASFVFNAEGGCYLAKDWPLPAHILDLSAEFRNITNGRLVPEGKGLLGALAYYGLDSIGTKHKEEMRKRIMQGRPFTPRKRRRLGFTASATPETWSGCCRRCSPTSI